MLIIPVFKISYYNFIMEFNKTNTFPNTTGPIKEKNTLMWETNVWYLVYLNNRDLFDFYN